MKKQMAIVALGTILFAFTAQAQQQEYFCGENGTFAKNISASKALLANFEAKGMDVEWFKTQVFENQKQAELICSNYYEGRSVSGCQRVTEEVLSTEITLTNLELFGARSIVIESVKSSLVKLKSDRDSACK